MSQLSLFTPEAKTVERRPPNPAFIRKNLNRLVRTVRDAERLPWSEAETKSWEELFPQLACSLDPEEGAALQAAFDAELARLRRRASMADQSVGTIPNCI